ncbi:cytochrome c-type biogenesis protein CcmH [Oleispirillum naphthae]|uniref:cytochrome c-type biogenesis protein CcmH n=1 Tax=Oleispirillum naphthae TaxID=2838853 RepID=UPI0030824B96
MRRLLLAAVLGFLSLAPAFAFEPEERLPDPVLETRARALSKELRCVVCRNQSIDESDAELAKAMRRLVRERLSAGDSDAEALAALQARYGDFIRLLPPLTVGTVLLWAAPVALLLGGLAAWRGAFRRPGAASAAEIPAEDAAALPRPAAPVLLAAAAGALLAAGAAYAALGRPGLPDQPYRPRLAERLGVSQSSIAEMEGMAERLETHIAKTPGDGRAWAMLGRAERYLDRHAEAAAALSRAAALGETGADTLGDLAESLILRDNALTPEALRLFGAIRAADPADPRAAWFLGAAAAEAGDHPRAAAIWRDAAARQPAGSAWRRRLEIQASRLPAP